MPIPLAFTKLLRSFESYAEAVEKLVIFRKGVSNNLDPDQDVSPNLGPNCLQRLSADNKSLKVARKEL